MESLALLASVILLSITAFGLLAFLTSWFHNPKTRILCYIFSGLALASGIWIGLTLREGNGLYIGLVPSVLAVFSIWNVKRRAN